MARPVIKIDKEQLEKLCGIHATRVEVADWFGISDDTLDRFCKREYNKSYAEFHKEKASSGKISLRRAMWKRALEGNVPLLIWLSKQHLGMTEKIESREDIKQDTTHSFPSMTKEQAEKLLKEKLK